MAKKRHDFEKKLRTVQSRDRKEVEAAVDILVKEVAQLALRIKQAVAVSDTAKAELTRLAVSASGMRTLDEKNDLLKRRTTALSPGEPQVVDIAEVAMFPLSPQQGHTDKAAHKSNSKTCRSQNESAPTDTCAANTPQENTVAARVAELRDRLGGFMPSPPIPSRQR